MFENHSKMMVKKMTADPSCICPPTPRNLEELGISSSFLIDLIIKFLYRYGVMKGKEIAQKLTIPFPIIDSLLAESLQLTYIEKSGGEGLGNSTDRFNLTDRGRQYAREILEQNTYTGPVPVPLDQYKKYVMNDNIQRIPITEPILREAWKDFYIDEEIYKKIGPAIRSGKSCFFYGPPGTGKTTIAKKIAELLDQCGGSIAIPHALLVGGNIIRIYDPSIHERVQQRYKNNEYSLLIDDMGDQRWVICCRPAVIVGGELSLDMLDLRYNSTTKYYEAPIQMKANGGVFILDDFGRQIVLPKDLLNRWIVPLEEGIDYLTLHTGNKFSVPFNQLIVFATNLDPHQLADEAFLRRIRYKMYVGEPSSHVYKRIFLNECQKKSLHISEEDLNHIIKINYCEHERPLRACDPRDITDQISDYCAFHNLSRNIPRFLLEQIASDYFTSIQ